MASNKMQFVIPPGRFIWGSMTELQKTNMQGAPIPEEKWSRNFGVAVRKDHPDINPLLGRIIQFGMDEYRNFPHVQQAAQAVIQRMFPHGNTGFAWKIKDGDQPNTKGQIPEHGRGCWIFSYSTTLPFKCCDNQNREIDPASIKTGYYVDVASSIAWNEKTDQTAGIYMNPVFVRLLAYGEEIIGGPSAEQAFGAAPAPTQLPPGASATPLAPAGGSAPGGMPGFGGFQPQPVQPAPVGFQPQPAPTGFQPQPNAALPGLPGGPAPVAGPYPVAGQPAGFAPPAYPSNPGMPAGFPTGPAGFQPPPNTGLPTGYPINPQTGQPVMPHTTFVAGPSR